jgi:hypothetical protein
MNMSGLQHDCNRLLRMGTSYESYLCFKRTHLLSYSRLALQFSGHGRDAEVKQASNSTRWPTLQPTYIPRLHWVQWFKFLSKPPAIFSRHPAEQHRLCSRVEPRCAFMHLPAPWMRRPSPASLNYGLGSDCATIASTRSSRQLQTTTPMLSIGRDESQYGCAIPRNCVATWREDRGRVDQYVAKREMPWPAMTEKALTAEAFALKVDRWHVLARMWPPSCRCLQVYDSCLFKRTLLQL